ncbi:MAG: WG repeat-containing protein [Muribaculaceae bacterium]|nr:WG repeat-containing protein [Muribaculaceae bacterium]
MKLSNCISSIMLFGALFLLCSCNSGGNNRFDDYDLIPVKLSENGKWSMVNDKGEVVYDGEFKNQPTAAYNGFFSVEEEGGYTVYAIGDKSPKPVKDLEKLKSVGAFSEGLMPVTFEHSRIAVVNKEGQKKFELSPVKGNEIVWCESVYTDGLLRFRTEDNKWGFYDTSGKIAIEPKYDDATGFSEGLAIVGTYKDADFKEDISYFAIDKSGKEVFKIKEGYTLVNTLFNNGYIIARKDDRLYTIDKKGEEFKLPSKITSISDYNGKYIIFENDGDCGVADMKGEIVIRAKYYALAFDTDNTFFAKKDSDDKEIIRLNSKGEEEKDKIDYEYLFNLGKFGYIAKEGKTSVLLDSKFNKKGKEEFFDFGILPAPLGGVETDYFSQSGVAAVMVSMIQGDKVGGIAVGESASSVFQGKSPKDYTYTTSFEISDAKKEGFRYEIEAKALFNNSIALSDFDYYSYDSNYYWNPNSVVGALELTMDTQSKWGKEGNKALKAAFEKEGYKILRDGTDKLLIKKGNILILTLSKSNRCIIDIWKYSDELEKHIMSVSDDTWNESLDNSSDDEADVVAVEEAVAEVEDTVVAVEDYDDW